MAILLADLIEGMSNCQLLVLAAIVLLTITILRRGGRRTGPRQPDAPMTSDRSTMQEEIRHRHNLDSLEVHFHDLFREMNGRLDTKLQVLNELLREADSKIAELRRLRGSSGQIETSGPAHPASQQQEPRQEQEASIFPMRSNRPTEQPAHHPKGDDSVDSSESDSPMVIELDRGVSRRTVGRPNVPAPAPAAEKPRYVEIYQLADQGLSALEIAEQVGRPAGEIELILGIRRRREQANSPSDDA